MRRLFTTWIAPAILLLATLAYAPAAWADCVDPRSCLCNANGNDGGLFRAEVQSVDNNGGAQLEVLNVYEEDPSGFNPDILAVTDFFEEQGREVLIREGGGYLVIVNDSVVTCPSGSFGDTLWINLDDARQLSTVSNCSNELAVVEIRGEFPECDDTPGSLDCGVSPHRAPTPLLAIVVAVGTLIVRRRGPSPE